MEDNVIRSEARYQFPSGDLYGVKIFIDDTDNVRPLLVSIDKTNNSEGACWMTEDMALELVDMIFEALAKVRQRAGRTEAF